MKMPYSNYNLLKNTPDSTYESEHNYYVYVNIIGCKIFFNFPLQLNNKNVEV